MAFILAEASDLAVLCFRAAGELELVFKRSDFSLAEELEDTERDAEAD